MCDFYVWIFVEYLKEVPCYSSEDSCVVEFDVCLVISSPCCWCNFSANYNVLYLFAIWQFVQSPAFFFVVFVHGERPSSVFPRLSLFRSGSYLCLRHFEGILEVYARALYGISNTMRHMVLLPHSFSIQLTIVLSIMLTLWLTCNPKQIDL